MWEKTLPLQIDGANDATTLYVQPLVHQANYGPCFSIEPSEADQFGKRFWQLYPEYEPKYMYFIATCMVSTCTYTGQKLEGQMIVWYVLLLYK